MINPTAHPVSTDSGFRSERRVKAWGLLFAAVLAGCGGGSGEDPQAQAAAAGGPDGSASRARIAAVAAAGQWVSVPLSTDPAWDNLNIPADAATRGMWSAPIPWPLVAVHSTLLPDGKLLTWGSPQGSGNVDGRTLDLWDPALGFGAGSHSTSFDPTRQDSFCGTSAFLPDGRLMLTGGVGAYVTGFYAQSSNSLVPDTSRLADERWYTTMINLPDGRPIVLGGMKPFSEAMQDNPDQAVAQGLASMTPEVYENGQWRTLVGAYSRDAFGPDYLRAAYPRTWVAPDGRLFGVSAETMWYLDPAGNGSLQVAGKFKTPPSATTAPNVGATNAAVMYAPGKILIAGGNGAFWGESLPGSSQVTSIDITSGAPVLTEQPPMATPRRYGQALVLPTGKVLMTGGTRFGNSNGANAVLASEVWDPATGAWSPAASAANFRGYHSLTVLMPNGTVLSAGGGATGPVNNFNAEVFYPPYLFTSEAGVTKLAPRPVMSAVSSLSLAHGATLQVDMTGADTVSQLVLVGLSRGTHQFNMGQRRVPLAFTQNSIRLTATVPANTVAPPG